MEVTRTSLRLIVVSALLALVASSCGGTDTSVFGDGASDDSVAASAADEQSEDHVTHMDDEDGHHDDHDLAFAFGEPGDPADADRVVEIDAKDDFTFGPEEITVSEGQTVTFVVTNSGSIPHDFTLGDESTQDAHEQEMAEMIASGEMGNHDDPNAVLLQAGETKELTWTFTEAGKVWFGCHQPGHYQAGMVGLALVEAA